MTFVAAFLLATPMTSSASCVVGGPKTCTTTSEINEAGEVILSLECVDPSPDAPVVVACSR